MLALTHLLYGSSEVMVISSWMAVFVFKNLVQFFFRASKGLD
jgi:hypothetical protein